MPASPGDAAPSAPPAGAAIHPPGAPQSRPPPRTRVRQALACKLCRRRKLKCDRQQPCSNCASRSLVCEPEDVRVRDHPRKKSRSENHGGGGADQSLLERLEKLESLLAVKNDDARRSRSPSSQIGVIEVHKDEALLETLSSSEKSLLPNLTDELEVFLMPATQELLTMPNVRSLRQVYFPCKADAKRLLENYFVSCDPFQHVLHQPSVRRGFDRFYESLESGNRERPNGCALMLAIMASSALSWPYHRGGDCGPIQSMQQAVIVCSTFVASAFDCLDLVRRLGAYTLEDVQAMTILFFLICHFEGYSRRFYSLLNEAIAVSKMLRLHRVDSQYSGQKGHFQGLSLLDLEMRRRLWWYLAATDWISGLSGGPQEGTYSITDKHMQVRLPLNLNDEDLDDTTSLAVRERPLSEPTRMSYTLQRIRLGKLGRQILDEVPGELRQATYAQVVSLNTRIDNFMEELPLFLRRDLPANPALDREQPYLVVQREVVCMLINLVRCKLHLPFLAIKGDPTLRAFSRASALHAARTILAARQHLAARKEILNSEFMKLQGLVHHMFCAASVFALDLSCNALHGSERDERVAELTEVCEVLSQVSQYSVIAGKFLDSLTKLLDSSNVVIHHFPISYKSKVASTASTVTTAPSPLSPPYPATNPNTTPSTNPMGFGSSNVNVNAQQDAQATIAATAPDDPLLLGGFDELWKTYVEQSSAFHLFDFNMFDSGAGGIAAGAGVVWPDVGGATGIE